MSPAAGNHGGFIRRRRGLRTRHGQRPAGRRGVKRQGKRTGREFHGSDRFVRPRLSRRAARLKPEFILLCSPARRSRRILLPCPDRKAGAMKTDYDIIIIGSGAGGGTLAQHLAPSGKSILILERGGWLKREPENWSAEEVFQKSRYVSAGHLARQERASRFSPARTTMSAARPRCTARRSSACARRISARFAHCDGISPGWPISYDDLEPYYTQAEQLYQVHGERGEDPTEPPASAPYPFPPVSHEPRIQKLSDDLAARGLSSLPLALRHHAQRGEHALQHLRALQGLRRLSLPRPRQVGCRSARRCGPRWSIRMSPCSPMPRS